MIDFSIHPEATKNINDKGNALLLELKPIQVPSSPKRNFNLGTHVKDTITSKDIIGDVKMAYVDGNGKTIAKCFVFNSKEIGLSGDSYQQLLKMTELIQRTNPFRQYISSSFLCNSAFSWAEKKYKGEETSELTDFIIKECLSSIHEFEIWVPVAMLYIQSEIEIGNILFKTLTSSIFDQWNEFLRQQDNSAKIDDWLIKKRSKLQGSVIATMKVVAEESFAVNHVLSETEKALSVLRFHSPANFFPEKRSFCTVLGKENLRSTNYFVFKEKAQFPSVTASSAECDPTPWAISNEELKIMEKPLSLLSQLLKKNNLNDFEDNLLTSVFIYSKASLCTEPSDKLLYVLTSLESLLLKNDNEPIQQNVADRIAFVLAKSAKDRMAIVKNYKAAYKLRSAFVHHGESIEEIVVFTEFLMNCWLFYAQVILNINKFQTKDEFIGTIEKIKYS